MQSYSQSSNKISTNQFAWLMNDSWIRRVCMALVFSFAASQIAFAQAVNKAAIEEKTLTTNDGVELKITYYKSSSGKEAPIVILLHGKKGTRLQWKGMANELQAKRDFAVVTVDLRGHGESSLKKTELKKSDYQAMVVSDMDAVRDFLMEEHQKGMLNINKQGIVACDFSAAVALVYTEVDWERPPYDDSPTPDLRTPRGQDVRALALISPDLSTPGLLPTKAAATLRNFPIAIMIGASEKDSHDLAMSKKLFDQVSVKRDKVESLYFEKYREGDRGMELILRDPQIRGHITGFLDKYVKQAQSEWKDRRSRLDRD